MNSQNGVIPKSWKSAKTPAGRRRPPCGNAIQNGRHVSREAILPTLWVPAHCICPGNTTVFTEHRTRERSAVGRQMAASVCSTNRLKSFTSGCPSALKSNSSDPRDKAEDTGMDKLTALIGAVFVIGGGVAAWQFIGTQDTAVGHSMTPP